MEALSDRPEMADRVYSILKIADEPLTLVTDPIMFTVMKKGEGFPVGDSPHSASAAVGFEASSLVAGILSGEADIRAAYLFGSAARGESRADSDVDVAVWMSRPLDSSEKVRLIEKISSACLCPVDLLDLRRVDPILLGEILRDGKPIIEPDVDVLEQLYQMVVRNEADYLPLLRRARRERVEAFARG